MKMAFIKFLHTCCNDNSTRYDGTEELFSFDLESCDELSDEKTKNVTAKCVKR